MSARVREQTIEDFRVIGVCHIAEVLPEVLAEYGIAINAPEVEAIPVIATSLDLAETMLATC